MRPKLMPFVIPLDQYFEQAHTGCHLGGVLGVLLVQNFEKLC